MQTLGSESLLRRYLLRRYCDKVLLQRRCGSGCLITDIKGRVSSDKLPLGKYRVEEVGAFDRETGEEIPDYKYHIIDGQNYKDITISPAEQTIKVIYCDMEQRNDGIPEIGTTARGSATGDSEGEYSETATIIDTVRYEKLEPGKEYTVKGKLWMLTQACLFSLTARK